MWTHIKASGGMGLEEQWCFRPYVLPVNAAKPLCKLRRNGDGHWLADLLNHTGISAAVLHVAGDIPLREAQLFCEQALREMGWEWKVKR
jgi:hypothetical protein